MPMKFNFDPKKLGEIAKRLEQLKNDDALLKSAGNVLFREATKIMNASKPLVPVDTGFLRQSGHVQPPQIVGNRVTVTLGYAAEYAIYVHENLNARHKVGIAKFLEVPFRAWKQGGLQAIADGFRAARAIGIGARKLG